MAAPSLLSDLAAKATDKDLSLGEGKHSPPPFLSVLKGIPTPLLLPPLLSPHPCMTLGQSLGDDGSSCPHQLGCTGAVLSLELQQQWKQVSTYSLPVCSPQMFPASLEADVSRGNVPLQGMKKGRKGRECVYEHVGERRDRMLIFHGTEVLGCCSCSTICLPQWRGTEGRERGVQLPLQPWSLQPYPFARSWICFRK